MRHVQLHATFFSCIRQVAKDNFSTSDINKPMLNITYILRLGQLLKIAPDFKKYMW